MSTALESIQLGTIDTALFSKIPPHFLSVALAWMTQGALWGSLTQRILLFKLLVGPQAVISHLESPPMSSSDFSLSSPANEGERELGGGLSDPSSAQYQLRRNVFDMVNTLQSYGYRVSLSSIIAVSIIFIQITTSVGPATNCRGRLPISRQEFAHRVYLRRGMATFS